MSKQRKAYLPLRAGSANAHTPPRANFNIRNCPVIEYSKGQLPFTTDTLITKESKMRKGVHWTPGT